MRKLTRYLVGDFLAIFAMAILLITFAMCIGAIYRVIDYMSAGVSAAVVGRFFLNNIPFTLAYSIPISVLFSTLLLFGRLSSDSELAALKSGGLSIWQISSPILLISIVLSAICLINSAVVFPATEYANRKIIKGMGVEDPIKLLDEGRFIREIPGYMIYIGKKNKNKVQDLVVYEIDVDTDKVTRTIRAASGIMTVDPENAELRIDLYDVRMEVVNPKSSDDPAKTRYLNAEVFPFRLSFEELLGQKNVAKKRRNMTMAELSHSIRNIDTEFPELSIKERKVQRCRFMVHMHQRICLSLAAFTFVLIAIPLGIKSHRKESSIGMVMSLGVMFAYYSFIIIADTLDDRPEFYPWLIPWAAILCAQVAGFVMLRRVD